MADKIKTTVGWPGHTETREIELPDGEPPPWDANSQLKIVSGRKYLDLATNCHLRIARISELDCLIHVSRISRRPSISSLKPNWAMVPSVVVARDIAIAIALNTCASSLGRVTV